MNGWMGCTHGMQDIAYRQGEQQQHLLVVGVVACKRGKRERLDTVSYSM